MSMILMLGIVFLTPAITVHAEESADVNPGISTYAYTDWVVRYFHQYQTRLTGNWAPSTHGYIYGSINYRGGYVTNGWTYLGTTSNSNWVTIEHKFSQNYRVW